jgi:hypothetical protein
MAEDRTLVPAIHERFYRLDMTHQNHPVVNGIGFQLAQCFHAFCISDGIVGSRQRVTAGVENQFHLGDVGFAHVMPVRFH